MDRSDEPRPLGPPARTRALPHGSQSRRTRFSRAAVFVATIALLAAAAAVIAARSRTLGVPGWHDRGGLKRVARQIVLRGEAVARAQGRRPREFAVYVYAEPALFYYLSADGAPAGPAGSLDFAAEGTPKLPVPTLLAVGPHAMRDERFQKEWERFRGRFEPIGTWTYEPSDVVLLNEFPAERIDDETLRQQEVRLFRLE